MNSAPVQVEIMVYGIGQQPTREISHIFER